MTLESKIQKYGVLVIGLLIGGGFAFGGIASYAGLTDTGNRQQQDGFDASLPSNSYQNSTFGLTLREQQVLAARNDVAFINVVRNGPPRRDFSSLSESLSGRAFIESANASQVAFDEQYGFTEFPQAVVVGSRKNARISIVSDVNDANLESAVCGAVRSWQTQRGSVVANCQG